MTTRWDTVHAALLGADSIAWDGCHKIYVLMDKEQTQEMRDFGYDDSGEEGLRLVNGDPDAALLVIQRWWRESCELRFVSAVRTVPGDPNEGFTNLIGQFEEEE